jgi:hypothetical protein
MHGTYIKIVDGQQAKMSNIFTNTKLKLLKTGVFYEIDITVIILCICWFKKSLQFSFMYDISEFYSLVLFLKFTTLQT